MGGKLPRTLKERRKLRLKVLPNTESHAINPVRQYERDCEMVLRGLARFIQKSGFCPQTKVLARRRTWLADGTQKYLEDLLAMGMVEHILGSVWQPSKAGWDFLGVEPIEPTYPPELVSKAVCIEQAKRWMHDLRDPEFAAVFDAIRAKEQHGNQQEPEA